MKKIAILLALLIPTTAYASYYTASGGVEIGEKAYITIYDENGVLCSVEEMEFADKDGLAAVEAELSDGMRARAHFTDGRESIWLDEYAEKAPEPTVAPTEAPTEAPSDTDYEYYDSVSDARNAPAVILKVSEAVDENDDLVTTLKVLYQGKEQEVILEEGSVIGSASDELADFVGESVSVLKAGDVVLFGYAFSGKINSLYFMYRPTKQNPINENQADNFENLIATEGAVGGNSKWQVMDYGAKNNDDVSYVFGAVIEKNKRSLTLANYFGSVDDMLELDFDDKTIVYYCDIAELNDSEITDTGDIYESLFAEGGIDEDMNVTSWEACEDCSVVLARVIDGTAKEIILYTGYYN